VSDNRTNLPNKPGAFENALGYAGSAADVNYRNGWRPVSGAPGKGGRAARDYARPHAYAKPKPKAGWGPVKNEPPPVAAPDKLRPNVDMFGNVLPKGSTESMQRERKLRKQLATNVCAKPGTACFLNPNERNHLHVILNNRITEACTTFNVVLVDAKLTDKLAPNPSAWEMVIEAFYVIGSVNAGPLAGVLAGLVPAIPHLAGWGGGDDLARSRKETQSRIVGTNATQSAIRIAIRSARTYAKQQVQGITNTSSIQKFYENLSDSMGMQKQSIISSLGALNDDQLIALAAFYDKKSHKAEVYRDRLNQIVKSYKSDVADIGAGRSSILRVTKGPHSRLAMFRWRLDALGVLRDEPLDEFPRLPGSYQRRFFWDFDHWIHHGFEGLATKEQQRQHATGNKKRKGFTLARVDYDTSVQQIRHNAPWMHDPSGKTKEWAANADTPRNKPSAGKQLARPTGAK